MRKRLHADRAVPLWRVLFGEQAPLLSSYSSFVLSERPGETGINHDEWQMSFLLFQLQSCSSDASSLQREISTSLFSSLVSHLCRLLAASYSTFSPIPFHCLFSQTPITWQLQFPPPLLPPSSFSSSSSHRHEYAHNRNRRSARHPQSTHYTPSLAPTFA